MDFDSWWKQYISEGGKSHFNITADKESAKAAWDAAIAAEREACAKAVEGTRMPDWEESCDMREVLATVIRERTNDQCKGPREL